MKKLLFFIFLPCILLAQMNLNNNTVKIDATGDLKYGFAHAVGSADSQSVALTVSQNVYKKIEVTGMTWHEVDKITAAADSVTILSAGDYKFDMSIRLSGTNANDEWRIKLFKNNVAFPTSVGRFVFRTVTNSQADTRSFFWYLKDLAINDVISWKITNLSASRNPTITDIKVYCEKKPE